MSIDLEIENILLNTSKKHGVTIEQIKSQSRQDKVSKARTECYVLLKDNLRLTLNEIADIFNKKTHSGISLAYNKYKGTLNSRSSPKIKNIEIKERYENTSVKRLVPILIEEKERIKEQLKCINNLLKLYVKD